MGSLSRWSAIDRYIQCHEQELLEKYQYLVGKSILGMGDTEVDYHVKAEIILSDGTIVCSHYRWSGELENYEMKEMDLDCPLMSEYYQEHLIGKTISHISIGTNRDDEVYVLAFVDETHCLEIPLGVDPDAVDKNGEIIENDLESEIQGLFYIVEIRSKEYLKEHVLADGILGVSMTKDTNSCERFETKEEAEKVVAELEQFEGYNAKVRRAREIIVLA